MNINQHFHVPNLWQAVYNGAKETHANKVLTCLHIFAAL